MHPEAGGRPGRETTVGTVALIQVCADNHGVAERLLSMTDSFFFLALRSKSFRTQLSLLALQLYNINTC